jgi:hypothetical protein
MASPVDGKEFLDLVRKSEVADGPRHRGGVCTQTPALRTLRLLPMLMATEGPGSDPGHGYVARQGDLRADIGLNTVHGHDLKRRIVRVGIAC